MPNADGLARRRSRMKELGENFYPALGFVSRSGVRDYTSQVGYTHFIDGGDVLQSWYGGPRRRSA